MIIFLELYFKHVQPVKFYPSGNNFTQALLVMLVTNIMSGVRLTVRIDLPTP